MRGLTIALLLTITCATTACRTQTATSFTVSQVARGQAEVGSLVHATVTEVRSGPPLLVELSDPTAEEHIWVTGFPEAPGRGEDIWTRITGPPVADDLVAFVYPAAGHVAPPVPRRELSDRGAVAILTGLAVVASCAVLAVAALVTGTRRPRRCPGCAGRVAPEWLTCPRCGHSLSAPAPPPAELVVADEDRGVDVVPTPLDDVERSAPTRIIPPA
ncbi:MAG: hypothetical protein ACRD12_19660 [Acidimicrobiales bacterium]